jgi:hypothetical protein
LRNIARIASRTRNVASSPHTSKIPASQHRFLTLTLLLFYCGLEIRYFPVSASRRWISPDSWISACRDGKRSTLRCIDLHGINFFYQDLCHDAQRFIRITANRR